MPNRSKEGHIKRNSSLKSYKTYQVYQVVLTNGIAQLRLIQEFNLRSHADEWLKYAADSGYRNSLLTILEVHHP